MREEEDDRPGRFSGFFGGVRLLFDGLLLLMVLVSVRRVVIHLPVSFPFLSSFRQIALAFGASSG